MTPWKNEERMFFEYSMLFIGGHCPAKLSYLISLTPPKTVAYFRAAAVVA